MSSDVLLKALGHLPHVRLDQLGSSYSRTAAGAIDSDVLATRLCGHPDRADEEIANATREDLVIYLQLEWTDAEALRQCHHQWLAAEEAGRGMHPTGCHMDIYPHENHHCVTYAIREHSFNQNYTRKASDDEIRHVAAAGVWGLTADQALQRFSGKSLLAIAPWFIETAMARIAVKFIRVEDEDDADIVMLGRYISGSTIGLGWFPNDSCSGQVESHYDTSWQPSLYRWILLALHELGHNLGFQHTFTNQSRHRGVMSYNWPGNVYGFLTGEEGILPRDPAWDQANRYYDSTNNPLPDQPEPDPPGDLLQLDGSLWAERIPQSRIAIRGSVTAPRGLPEDTKVIAYPDPEAQDRYILKEPPPI